MTNTAANRPAPEIIIIVAMVTGDIPSAVVAIDRVE